MPAVQSRPPCPQLYQIGKKFPGHHFELGDGTQVALEDLYLVLNHLQWLGKSRTYVYYQDMTLKGLDRTWQVEKRLEIPKGR
jgi:hypothetical protein